MSIDEYEKKLLALPIANSVSAEHEEHTSNNPEFLHMQFSLNCGCSRCRIIRIKKRRAFRFPHNKCQVCGKLFVSLFSSSHCPDHQ